MFRKRFTAVLLLILSAWLGCNSLYAGEQVVFNYRLATDPPTLDPALSTDTTSGAVVLKIHDGLVQFDPMTLEAIPAVAESWEVSEDGLTYTFHLRKDVKFHNGRPLTAEDVLQSYQRTLNPATKSADPEARLQMYRQAEKIAVAQAPWIFIYYESELPLPFSGGICLVTACVMLWIQDLKTYRGDIIKDEG